MNDEGDACADVRPATGEKDIRAGGGAGDARDWLGEGIEGEGHRADAAEEEEE